MKYLLAFGIIFASVLFAPWYMTLILSGITALLFASPLVLIFPTLFYMSFGGLNQFIFLGTLVAGYFLIILLSKRFSLNLSLS
jgi:hypothetical protein